MTHEQASDHKSRLGTLLLHKGIITRQQLDDALTEQANSQMRLGEVLIAQGSLTELELKRALKKQSKYRLIAAVSTAILAPLQPFSAAAAGQDDLQPIAEQHLGEHAQGSSLTPLSDTDLSNTVAQGISENTASLKDLTGGFLPLDEFIDADIEVKGVTYGEKPAQAINPDGSMNVQVPTKIEQVSFRNIKLQGDNGPVFGDVVISNIEISSQTRVSIRPRA